MKRPDEEMVKLNQELSILNAISQTVNQATDLDEILNNSLDKMMEMTEVRSAGFYLLEVETDVLLYVARRENVPGAFSKGMRRLQLGEGVTGKVAQTGEPMFVEDYPSHPDALPHAVQEGLKSLAVVPLKSREKIYGTLNITRREFHKFNVSDMNLFISVGQLIGGALERAALYTENVRRLEEQRTINSISREIASRLELKVILQKIVDCAVELLEAESAEITLWDTRKQNYAISVVHGLPNTLIGREIVPPLSSIVGEICTTKRPVVYQDYEHHPNHWGELDPYHFKEVLGVPLIVRQMIIGTMVVYMSRGGKHFKQSEIDLLFNFAHQAAIAIGNAKLYEDSLSKIKQLTILHEIGKTLSSTLDLDELLTKALELLEEHLGYTLCRIFFLDQEKDELYIKEAAGVHTDRIRELRLKVGADSVVGWVAKTGELLYVPDVLRDSRYIPGAPGARSEAAFPLKARDRVIGVMDIENKEIRGFDEEDLKALSSFANQVGIFIVNARLFSDLKETLKELKQAQDRIVQAEKLRAMGEMASGVAHDFNNILSVILGNIQLLLRNLDKLGPVEIQDRLKAIEGSSRDGAETIRRIQEFTGVRKDKEFTALSINQIIDDVVILTQARWKDQPQSRGVQIQLIKKPGEVPPLLGSPSELREVLMNIIFNAVDAMPEGGTLTLSTEPQEDDWVEVKIADTGIGMTEDLKGRIFDPFFTTKGVTNSGLGLSVSYGIVKRHGGEILVESEVGKGTTFLIHLPIGNGKEEAEGRVVKPVKETRPAQILVIDDEEAVRDILLQILHAKGHQVVLAANGEEGIERFKNGAFDLVFTDLGMPRISGWEVSRTIKGIDPKVSIVMITGWGMEVNREKMNESGISFVVTKPFEFDDVILLVSKALEAKDKA